MNTHCFFAACQFDISRATDLAALPELRREMIADETLDPADRNQLLVALENRRVFLASRLAAAKRHDQ